MTSVIALTHKITEMSLKILFAREFWTSIAPVHSRKNLRKNTEEGGGGGGEGERVLVHGSVFLRLNSLLFLGVRILVLTFKVE